LFTTNFHWVKYVVKSLNQMIELLQYAHAAPKLRRPSHTLPDANAMAPTLKVDDNFFEIVALSPLRISFADCCSMGSHPGRQQLLLNVPLH
jgi:hypothetical protein